jgi:phenylpropionate dioxygenase-like ring-hydroxylating dioxygenase large terminal subunit
LHNDRAHFPFVHAKTIGRNQPKLVRPYDVSREGWTLQVDYPVDFGGKDLLQRQQLMRYWVAAPASIDIRLELQGGGSHLVAQFACPVSSYLTRQFWLVGGGATLEERAVSLDQAFAWDVEIFDEDRLIAEAQRPKESPLASGVLWGQTGAHGQVRVRGLGSLRKRGGYDPAR